MDVAQFKGILKCKTHLLNSLDFIDLFQELILNDNFDGKKEVTDYISGCFRTLISEYSEDIFDQEDTILEFFRDFFKQSSTKTHEKFYFNMLSAFNHFIYFKGFNKAQKISEIGVELIESMCSIWREKTNDNLRVNFNWKLSKNIRLNSADFLKQF